MAATSCTTEMPQMRYSPRERILDAATQFAENGFEHTSTLSIARASGTSETQLMKNFINKQGLLEAVFARVLAEMSQLLDGVRYLSSPRDQLRLFCVSVLSWLHENPELCKMLLLDMRRIRAKHGGEVLSAPGARDFRRQLDQILEAAGRAGQLKCTMRPDLIRAALFGAIGGLLRDSLIAEEAAPSGVKPDDVENMLDYLLSCFFV
jgi:AcrR family transcriptional regulator